MTPPRISFKVASWFVLLLLLIRMNLWGRCDVYHLFMNTLQPSSIILALDVRWATNSLSSAVIKLRCNGTVILHCVGLRGEKNENTIKESARWGIRWRSRLSSLQSAAGSITHGALDIHRATGHRNMPERREKNAINTFLLFSPSLSPDLFIFLELCLRCLALTEGDVGQCSSTRYGRSPGLSGTRVYQDSPSSCLSHRADVQGLCVKLSFNETFFEDTLTARQRELQVPERTCARSGSSFGTLHSLRRAGTDL